MFDIGWQELFVIAVIVVLVVGPKDLPRVLRTVGMWVGRARSMVREFQGHVDDMMREAELDEVKKQIEDGKNQFAGAAENTIDPNGELRDATDYGGEEFADVSADSVTGGEYTPPGEEAPGEEAPGEEAPGEEAPTEPLQKDAAPVSETAPDLETVPAPGELPQGEPPSSEPPSNDKKDQP